MAIQWSGLGPELLLQYPAESDAGCRLPGRETRCDLAAAVGLSASVRGGYGPTSAPMRRLDAGLHAAFGMVE